MAANYLLGTYAVIITMSAIFSHVKITHLESLLKASVGSGLKNDMRMVMGMSACIFVADNSDFEHIPEYISVHLTQGIFDYTFYVNDDDNDALKAMSMDYANLGMSVSFKQRTNRQTDMWECLADNVFDPYINRIYISTTDLYLFPLNGEYGGYTDTDCTSFKQFEFSKSGHESLGVVGSNRNRTRGFKQSDTLTKVLTLGKTGDERLQLLKSYRRGDQCKISDQTGVALLTNRENVEETISDDRLFLLSRAYHAQISRPELT